MKDQITTTIEITDLHIKLIQSTSARGASVISFCQVAGITQPSDGEISKALAFLVTSSKIKLGQLICVIPRRFAILRPVSLPSHSDEEINKMVALQVTKQVPYPKEDVILDHVILKKDSAGYAKVLIVAVHKEVVGRYLKIFQDAGLNPQTLTLSSAGLLSWYHIQQKNVKLTDSRPVAIINIDTQATEICFCHGQKLLFSRSINFGAKDLHADNVAAFVEEVGLTLTTYTRENIGDDITKLIIVTTLAQVSLLQEKLSAEFKLPIETLQPFDNIPQKKDLRLPMSEGAGLSFAVGAGLCLADPKTLIDLIPSEVSGSRAIKAEKAQWLRFFILLIVTGTLLSAAIGAQTYKSSLTLGQLHKQIEATQPKVDSIKDKTHRIQFMRQWLSPNVTAIDVIRELYNLTPPEVFFSSVYLDENGNLILQGASETGAGVSAFQRNLVGSSYFKDVALQYVTKRKVYKGELTDFKITCQVK